MPTDFKMPNDYAAFWCALLDYASNQGQRVRLWNGYIGWKLPTGLRTESSRSDWPRYSVRPPPDGWPELTESERSELDVLASKHGGHPTWRIRPYMDFSRTRFESEVDLSELTLVDADFHGVQFPAEVTLQGSRFFMEASFADATFNLGAYFREAYFASHVTFRRVRFTGSADFLSVEFHGGAAFDGAVFQFIVDFNNSKFGETFFSEGFPPKRLASFREVDFRSSTSFCNVVFGEDPAQTENSVRPRRLADFSDAQFRAETQFRRAVFNGAPAFFNCHLHEDTDFSLVHWPKAMPDDPLDVEYAIRAWERLELIMSQLEKPLDRHRFFRLKMRTRRLKDGIFPRVVNYLFDVSSDYGWSLTRAAVSWVGHWLAGGLVLFVSAGQAAVGGDALKLLGAALGTAFANAHAFLALAGKGGYLESCRVLIGQHDHWGLLAAVGVIQAILGPVLLFVLLLTMRNRFRLA